MLKTCGPSSPVKKSISSQPHSPIFRSTNIGQQKTKDGDQGKTGSRKFSDSVKVSGSSTARKSQSASSKKDIRARYWAYLFENLHRAVDEIYQTCESDESVVECKVWFFWPIKNPFEHLICQTTIDVRRTKARIAVDRWCSKVELDAFWLCDFCFDVFAGGHNDAGPVQTRLQLAHWETPPYAGLWKGRRRIKVVCLLSAVVIFSFVARLKFPTKLNL